MTTPHPTRIVRFQLLAVLLGVSIPFAIEDLIHAFTPSMLVANIAFLLTALNFFHGKVVTLEDEDYNSALTDRPGLALMDYIFNLAVILCFVFLAFFLDKPGRLIVVVLILRTLDTILVLTVRSVLPREPIRRAQNFWLTMNICTIVVFLLFTYLYWPVSEHHIGTATLFLIIILVDIVVDYSVNSNLYFSMADSWDDMAEFWDAMQGKYGDIFRRAVIIPAIKTSLRGISGKRILDVGCGNGCISRALVTEHYLVTAIDKSQPHLDIAESYDVPGITYKKADLDSLPCAQLENEKFDAAVACFTLQDCKTLQGPMRLIAENLKTGGSLIIIRDNDESFERVQGHLTTRRWLGSQRHNGIGRRQLVFWSPEAIRIGRGGLLGSEDEEIALGWSHGYRTITRYWNNQSYEEAAKKVGLVLAHQEDKLPVQENSGVPQTIHLTRYQRNPRLGMLVFTKV